MSAFRDWFIGKGAFTYSGEPYPLVDARGQSSIPGLFVIGDLAGTPDIKAALNGGWRLAHHITSLPRPSLRQGPHEVIIVGAGPAGVNAALEFEKAGISYLLLEKDRLFGTLDRFAKTHLFFVASKGDPAVRGDLPFDHDCTAGELVADWKKRLEGCRLNARYGEAVTGIQKRDLFEVRTGKAAYLAQRVIVAVGKHVHLRKLEVAGARDPKVRYVWDDDAALAGKRLLVLCAGSSDLAMEQVCRLSERNRVILACDHPPAEPEHRVAPELMGRVMQLAQAGNVEILGDVKLQRVDPTGAVVERDGREQVVRADYVLPLTPLEQEVPVEELRLFGLKFENTWDARRIGALIGAVALVAAFYYSLRLWGGSLQLGPLNGWNLDTMLYSLVVVGFGIPAMLIRFSAARFGAGTGVPLSAG